MPAGPLSTATHHHGIPAEPCYACQTFVSVCPPPTHDVQRQPACSGHSILHTHTILDRPDTAKKPHMHVCISGIHASGDAQLYTQCNQQPTLHADYTTTQRTPPGSTGVLHAAGCAAHNIANQVVASAHTRTDIQSLRGKQPSAVAGAALLPILCSSPQPVLTHAHQATHSTSVDSLSLLLRQTQNQIHTHTLTHTTP